MTKFADLAASNQEYVQKRLNEERSRREDSEQQAHTVASDLQCVCEVMAKLSFGPFTSDPKHVTEAKKQFQTAIDAAFPHIVAALGAAAVVLSHRVGRVDEIQKMTAEEWHNDHNGGDC